MWSGEFEYQVYSSFIDGNLDLMTRPVNYLSYETVSNDGQAHDVSLYFEAAPQWAVDQPYQKSS